MFAIVFDIRARNDGDDDEGGGEVSMGRALCFRPAIYNYNIIIICMMVYGGNNNTTIV